jgi:hypothetical protein
VNELDEAADERQLDRLTVDAHIIETGTESYRLVGAAAKLAAARAG